MQTFVVFREGEPPLEIEADTYALAGDDWVLYQAAAWSDPDRREIRRFKRAEVKGIALKDWSESAPWTTRRRS